MEHSHVWHVLGITMQGTQWVSLIDLVRAVFHSDDTRFMRAMEEYKKKYTPSNEAMMIRWTMAYTILSDVVPAEDTQGHEILDVYDMARLEKAAKIGWERELVHEKRTIERRKRSYNAAVHAVTDWHIPKKPRLDSNKPSS